MLKSKERSRADQNGAPVISIIGAGMHVTGDLRAEGSIRIEGTVHGSVQAGKAVVIGKGGVVEGDVTTEDAIVSGEVRGTLIAGSRLEIQATARIEGEVRARRVQIEEGAVVNGSIEIGDTGKSERVEQATALAG